MPNKLSSMPMNILDPLGSVFALTATYYCVKANPLTWFFTILATLCSAVLFYQGGIYGDMALQGVYFFMAFYGLYKWRDGAVGNTIRNIRSLTRRESLYWCSGLTVSIPMLAWFLNNIVHSTVPYLDSTTTLMSLLAQWFTSRKIIEAWYLWFCVDILYIFLYAIKDMPFHSGLGAVYLAFAIAGYLNWQKIKNTNIALNAA